jgi:hypothetical protein
MRRAKYAADGLTIDWYDTQPSVPANRADWWATNPDKSNPFGFSYCIVNAHNPAHIAAITTQLSELTTVPYEILTFTDEKQTMPELYPYCKYSWTQRISDDSPNIIKGYNPKVSIVLTTFKRQHCLLRTIGWVRAQSYENWELLVINNEKNGPPLPPMPVDPRISVYNPTAEANGCYSRNEGVKLATGDLVCNFDDDDEMLPGYLAKMVAPFSDPDVQVVRCGMLLTKGACDFSYSTQEAWLRRQYATPTWLKGTAIHDQIYYHNIIEKNQWTRKNIVQLGEVLVKAYSEPMGGRRSQGAED